MVESFFTKWERVIKGDPPMRQMPQPRECPHCEYDRRFPGFEGGGWMQQDNNGPIVSCPMCNDDGKYPR